MTVKQYPLVILSTLLALVWLLTAGAQAQQFQLQSSDPFQQPEFLPVDEAFAFNFKQDGDQLTLQWTIAPSYYLYQHRFAVKSDVALQAQPQLPEGEPHVDEFFGETVVYRDYVEITYELQQAAPQQTFVISYQGCADAGLCYPPTDKTIALNAVQATGTAVSFEQITENSQQSESASIFDAIHEQPLWLSLGLFLVLGIGLAFTPCVLPMYPIISAIIMGSSGPAASATGSTTAARKPLTTLRAFTLSFAYVQGMAVTYSALGIVVALAGLRYQAMLQHPVLLVVLALVFVLLALSMMGVYTITLPSKWQNYLNSISQGQRGGAHSSVFIMGALSGLIASPCTTAPLSGVLLFIAQSGDIVNGGAILYALSIGMGLPLLVFGVTGGKLLPKAGAWMNTVKRLFGVILLAVALVLVERLLPFHVADWLWVLFICASAIYLIVSGWAEMARKPAMVFSSVWLILASGLLYAWWPQPSSAHLPFKQVTSVAAIEAELAAAAANQQWVMLDLYADWCVACKEFERYTFANEQVQQALSDVRLLQADVTANTAENNAILQHYQVLGLPTILFFYAGEEVQGARVTGFLPADEFTEHVKSTTEN